MNEKDTFEFMLKEYELLYSKFTMHYAAVEKTITLYLIVIGSVLSINGLIIKDWSSFSVFSLSDFQILCCFSISIVGVFVILKVIEHRLLIISYVKSVNLLRKWFFNNSPDRSLSQYAFFESTVQQPPFYKPYRHFYWEVLGLGCINAVFMAISIINVVKHLDLFPHKNHVLINWIWFAMLVILVTTVMLCIYRTRGKYEEARILEKKIDHS